MKETRFDILLRPLFLISLALLLINDHFLKYEYSNFLTGKLSDFSGLFFFAYFLSAFKPKSAKSIYITLGVLFVLWKSEISQPFFDFSHNIGFNFDRIVDYSDLTALLILPISFLYFQNQLNTKKEIGPYITTPLSFVCVVAFCATSQPKEQIKYEVEVNSNYIVSKSKKDVLSSMSFGHGYSDTIERNLIDSLFYMNYNVDNRGRIRVLTSITSLDSVSTKIKLLRILFNETTGKLFSGVNQEDVEYSKSLTKEELKRLFKENVIKPIKDGTAKEVFFDNQEIDDKFEWK